MSAREFNAFLRKIQTDIRKTDSLEFKAHRNEKGHVFVCNQKANRIHECTLIDFKNFCQIGFFNAHHNDDFEPFLKNEISSITFEGNKRMLFKKPIKHLGVEKVLITIMLFSAFILLGLALFMKHYEYSATGNFSYSKTGNQITTQNLQWNHVLYLSLGLFLVFLFLKFTRGLKR